jgi:hypothetical protein
MKTSIKGWKGGIFPTMRDGLEASHIGELLPSLGFGVHGNGVNFINP